jgi:hypothetical protein
MRGSLFWTGGTIIGLSLLALLIYSYELLVPDDPWGLARFLVLKAAVILVCIPAVAVSWLFLDHVTPGDWFEEIQKPDNVILLHCVIVLAITWILVSG